MRTTDSRSQNARPASLVAVLWTSFVSHFPLCTYAGMITLWAIYTGGFENREPTLGRVVVAVGLNGLLVLAITWLFHRVWRSRYMRGESRRKGEVSVAVVAFVCGALAPFLFLVPEGLLCLAVLALLLVVVSVRWFLRRAVRLLRPGHAPRWADIGALVHVSCSLIALYSLLNTSLALISKQLGGPPPFAGTEAAGVVDSLYFSIVVVTTLGFGDIHPVTPVAKLLVSVQCLTSYVLWALLVGIVTRGVVDHTGPDDESGPTSTE